MSNWKHQTWSIITITSIVCYLNIVTWSLQKPNSLGNWLDWFRLFLFRLLRPIPMARNVLSFYSQSRWRPKRAPLCFHLLQCLAWVVVPFNSGTELEASEWIKFLVLETIFSSNSSRTHRLILSTSAAMFVSSCLYFPACPVIGISGS